MWIGSNIVKRVKNGISRLFVDKGDDSAAIYNELEDKAVIPPRKEASTISMVSLIGLKLQDLFAGSMRNYGR